MEQARRFESKLDIAKSRLQKLTGEVLSLRMIGFALSQAWIYTVLFSRALSPESSFQISIHSSFYDASLVALVSILFIAGFVAAPMRSFMNRRLGQWLPGILCAAGTAMLPLGSFGGLSTVALMAGAVATGIGSGMLQVFWGRCYAKIGGPAAASEAAVAFALASLVSPLLLNYPIAVRLFAALALVLGSSAALSKVVDADLSLESDGEEDEGTADLSGASARNRDEDRAFEQAATPRNDGDTMGFTSVFLRLMVSSLILGACTSIMQGFFTVSSAESHDFMYAIAMPIASIISGAILIFALLFSQRLDVAFTYQPVVPVIILGCLTSLFLGQGSVIACALVLTSYQLFGLINWTLLSSFSYYQSIPSIRIFGLGRASLSGGVLVGHALLAAIGGVESLTFGRQTALLMAVIFAASVACTFIFTPRTLAQTLRRQWLRLPPRETSLNEVLDRAETELTLDDKIEIVAQEYDITGRMLEVFELMARGRTGTRIEQELYMSKGTVKTHTRRIYQKLDVHSKQEMLDLIERAV